MQVKMPQLGETVVEGTITRWLKQEGEAVEADEALLEVSTDKVDSEIPSPVAGTLTKILVQEGDTVQVGAPLAEIGEEGEAAAPDKKADEAPAAEEKVEEQVKAGELEKAEEQEKKEKKPAEKPAAEVPSARGEAQRRTVAATDAEPRRGILSPLVRKLAAEAEIDLELVKGSGTGGRITKQDVMDFVAGRGRGEAPAAAAGRPAAAAEAAPKREVAAAPGAGEEVVQVTHMRKAIAEHMVASHLATARAWNAVEVDLTKIGRLREIAGAAFREREGFSLTWMPFIAKAVSQALLKFPQVNSTWNEDGTITRKYYVNLGIAVALENGLIVPVVKGADGMNIAGLARAIRDIADRARNKKLSPDEVHGGTFTITNPGPFGSILSVPIINQGQTGILATDAVAKRPVVVTDDDGEDAIAIRQMVFLSMSWDHRSIDGAEAAQFLSHLKTLLEEADFESDLSAYIRGDR